MYIIILLFKSSIYKFKLPQDEQGKLILGECLKYAKHFVGNSDTLFQLISTRALGDVWLGAALETTLLYGFWLHQDKTFI